MCILHPYLHCLRTSTCFKRVENSGSTKVCNNKIVNRWVVLVALKMFWWIILIVIVVGHKFVTSVLWISSFDRFLLDICLVCFLFVIFVGTIQCRYSMECRCMLKAAYKHSHLPPGWQLEWVVSMKNQCHCECYHASDRVKISGWEGYRWLKWWVVNMAGSPFLCSAVCVHMVKAHK